MHTKFYYISFKNFKDIAFLVNFKIQKIKINEFWKIKHMIALRDKPFNKLSVLETRNQTFIKLKGGNEFFFNVILVLWFFKEGTSLFSAARKQSIKILITLTPEYTEIHDPRI